MLVAAVLVGSLSQRDPARSAASIATIAPLAVATQVDPSHVAEPTSVAAIPGTIVVRAPHHGVYDSLWRIAQREFGNGARWPEVFTANVGRLQPDGRTLTDASLIQPGWVLILPPGAQSAVPTPASGKAPVPPAPTPSPAPASRAPAATLPKVPPIASHQRVSATTVASEGGIELVAGAFVTAGLAGAVATALTVRRRRRRRTYQPGSGDPAPAPPLAPIVQALRVADDEHRMALLDEDQRPEDRQLAIEPEPQSGTPVGVVDGRAQALDLAALQGLGVVGAGAEATVRALLVCLLGTTPTTVVIPRPDAVRLLGADVPNSPRLCVPDTLDGAIAILTAGLDSRHTSTETTKTLVTSIDAPDPRLQSLLDNGSDCGISGILLGHWPAGSTVRVGADGMVTAASPEVDAVLRSARMFNIDANDTRDLIDLFTDTPTSTTVSPADATTDIPESTLIDEPGAEPAATPISDEPNEHPSQYRFRLSVLGPVTLHRVTENGDVEDVTALLAPKHRQLLVFLALHPKGATRDAVREALWPDVRGPRPFNAFYATLAQIRKQLRLGTHADPVELVVQHGDHVAVNMTVTEVDYWRFNDADHARRIAATDHDRVSAWSQIAALYHGEIADGLTALWLDAPREAAHRTAVDALAGLAAHHRGTDPHRRLQYLEHARLLDPDNEAIYRDIMRTQADLGMTDAISRTVQLLSTTLAETGDRPAPDTLTLARALQARQAERLAAT
jgi:DNA-binding SARP family transcriptional activator